MENVTQVHSKKNINEFQKWIKFLEELGYSNFYEDMNAKDYGIPQNRNRTFMVSLLNTNKQYEFPKPFRLELRLKDMLEDNVDEKYFLSDKMIEYITANNEKWTGNNNKSLVNKSIASTINTGEGSRRCDSSNYIIDELPENTDIKEAVRLGGVFDKDNKKHQAGSIWDANKISPTLDTMQGGYRQPCIFVKEKTKKGYAEAKEGDGIYIDRPQQKRGVVQKGMIQTIKTSPNDLGVIVLGNYSPSEHNASRIIHPEGIAPTVMENHGTVTATVVAAAERGKSEGWKQEIEVFEREYVNKITNAFTKTQAKMITPDGNIKRYIGSNIVDIFEEGDCADISFPNGYNKGNRVFKGYVPTLNRSTTQSSFIVKVKDKVNNEIPLYTKYKKLIETIEQNKIPLGEIKHMDLYNKNLTENCGTLTDPKHNNNRLWDGLRVRKLTPRECFRLMGIKDESINKIQNLSNTQAYKQAGNGIVVNVLMEIFKKLIN